MATAVLLRPPTAGNIASASEMLGNLVKQGVATKEGPQCTLVAGEV